jgi:small subunit ribosomal protein S5
MFNKNKEDSLIEKIVSVNKNSKVVTGGKTLSFSVLVVVGDKKGKVNFGKGKAKEVADARTKAFAVAKRILKKVPLKEGRTIHHDCEGEYGACKVVIRSAPSGTGIIAGGIMRNIFECLGIKDIVSKTIGSNNPYNVVLATFDAFSNMNSPKLVADRRGKNINEIIKRRNSILNIEPKGDKEEKVTNEKEEK